jgi:hypothetical protein
VELACQFIDIGLGEHERSGPLPVGPQSHTARLPLGSVRLRDDCRGPHSASHEKAAIGWRNPIRWTIVGGRIMKMTTREQLFAAPRLARRTKARFDRGMEAVSAARARATEIAQQCAALPKLIPTASHRRRLARLRASVS